MDGMKKHFLLPVDQPVSANIALICEKLGCDKSDLGLFLMDNPDPLRDDLSIPEQVESLDAFFFLQRGCFAIEGGIKATDQYLQHRDEILERTHILPSDRDRKIELAAIVCHIEHGPFAPDLCSNISEQLFEMWEIKNDRGSIEMLEGEWLRCDGMTKEQSSFRFVQVCRSLSTYGAATFPAQIVDSVKVVLVIGRNRIFIFDDSRNLIREWPFFALKRFRSPDEQLFEMDFLEEDGPIRLITSEGQKISDLIAGYLEISMKHGW
eukprot:TRINITY_DN1451_c0_g1_i1.p1 TRINITY_DN1451_c0_g1~~TRINITY_DN1451_c0_g1_i1.p1  ORF type:complete len:265 (-),score=35.17 TRINITY_DN1451_c0_g1_i1:52-846(-)